MATRWRGRAIVAAALAALLIALVACGGNQPPGKGSLAGSVVVGSSATGGVAAATGAGAAGSGAAGTALQARTASGSDSLDAALARDGTATGPRFADQADFVPGELIVGFVPPAGVASASLFEAAAVLESSVAGLALERSIGTLSAGLYRAAGLDAGQTLALAAELRARPDVAYVELNHLVRPLLIPADPLYVRQWHYRAIDMESAWDITTGSSGVVVAVLDSGILYSTANPSLRHPDFAGRVLPGYDFVSSPASAVDGDGRDSDPFDDGGGVYHGSHVAGTIGAASDNGIGVAGVDWSAKILPVRVIGEQTGTVADIVDALLWAVGEPVSGVPANANPADVINLSLGVQAACSQFWQEALDVVTETAIVVVAAGNSNVNVSGFTPAGCAGVIAVGATDRFDERAPYSNFGSRIDVMAPGGDLTVDLDGDTFVDGVASIGRDATTDAFSYTLLQGTSMAAPHVAGVVALMRALDPTIDTTGALAALRASATPLTSSACDGQGAPGGDLISSDCGAGLIDAALALGYVRDGEIPDPPGAMLRFTPSALEFGASTTAMSFTITNISGATLDWELLHYEEAGDNPGTMGSGAFVIPDGSPFEGTLTDAASVSTSIVIDRSKLSADGNYQINLLVDIDGGLHTERLLMRFTKTTMTSPNPTGPMIVAAYIEDEFGALVESGSQSSAGILQAFDFQVASGTNLLAGWSDENGNGLVDDGDLFGVYPFLLDVGPGQRIANLMLVIDPVVASSPQRDARLVAALERAAGPGAR